MGQRTQGEWELTARGVPEIHAGGVVVCTLPMIAGEPANPADAALIAAAPDTLAALERALRDENDPLHVAGCVDNPNPKRACCWVKEARAAIAKARGKS